MRSDDGDDVTDDDECNITENDHKILTMTNTVMEDDEQH